MSGNAEEPAALARRLIDSSSYLTLATADADGRPWASPVWYAAAGYRELLGVSSPDARHSRHLGGARPEAAIVIFDLRAALGEAQAVYMAAVAEEITAPGSSGPSRSSRAARRRAGRELERSTRQGDRRIPVEL